MRMPSSSSSAAAITTSAGTRNCSTAATSTAASGTNSTGTSLPGLRRMKSFRSRARRSDPAPDQLVRLFQSETAEILESPEPSGVRATVYVLAGFMVALLLVAVFVRLDRVVYSSGQVVTTQSTVVLQALDPSLIKTIEVREGERVKAGEVLATLDPTFAAADVGALTQQVASLDAQIARCEAELANRPYDPAPARDPTTDRYVQLQRSFYQQRKAQREGQIRAYDEQ